MHQKLSKFILIQLFFLKSFATNNILIIDTYNQNPYSYNSLIQTFKDFGFNSKFMQFYNVKNENLENFNIIFLLISSDFLNNLDNTIVLDVIKKIKEFKILPNILLSLVFPNDEKINDKIKFLLKDLKILNKKNGQSLDKKINAFFDVNLFKIKSYDTSLYIKQEGVYKNPLANKNRLNLKNGLFLPLVFLDKNFIKNNFNFGLIFKNEKCNNFIFISKMPLLFFDEIEEDYNKPPLA